MPLFLLVKPSKKKPGTAKKGLHDYMHKYRKRTQSCYPVEAPQEFDQPGKELDPDAQVWKTYVQEADQVDEELVDGWNKSMDVILIFAALFSAISTAFVIESYKNLKQDPADTSSQALLTISQTLMFLANGSQPATVPSASDEQPTVFKASAKAICVNVLWFLSLSLSVAVSLISMLAKEWCLEFMSGRTGPPGAQARRRQQRWDGLVQWRMKEVIMVLPSLIHLSLLLFAIGLCLFLWDVHYGVAIPVMVVTTIAAGVYSACTVVPFFYNFCPYGTVLSRILKDFTLPRAKANQGSPPQDEVTARALHWMIVTCETPRSVNTALQSLAAAKEGLPPDELEKINAWGMIKRQLNSTDETEQPELSHTIGVLYRRAIETYSIIRRNLDVPLHGRSDETRRLNQLVLGVQSTISSLIHEVSSNPRPLDQGTSRVLERCTCIGQHYLYLGVYDLFFVPQEYREVDPANLVGEITNLLEQYLRGEVEMDSDLYCALSSGLAFAMCCNVAWGITDQSGYVLRLLRGYSAGRKYTSDPLMQKITRNLLLGTSWLCISHDYSNSKPLTSPSHAPMEMALETLWNGLMNTIYSESLVPNNLDVTYLAHGVLHLLANPYDYRLTSDDSGALTGILESVLWVHTSHVKIQHNHHARYILDISRSLAAVTHVNEFSPQFLAAIDILRDYSPWDDGYILLTPEIYMFLVKHLCLNDPPDNHTAYRTLEYSPFFTCSLRIAHELSAHDIVTHLSSAMDRSNTKKRMFATAQLWLLFNMSLREPDRTSVAISTLEKELLKYPELKSLGRQKEVAEELETELALLLDQYNVISYGGVYSFCYRVLGVMLQQRCAPLHDLAHDFLQRVPSRLRGTSAVVSLEAKWIELYPEVALKSSLGESADDGQT
ncbi:Acetyl-CoA carboxylase 1 [Rhizoctonia solani]|uniref:Acetyl-CoA carboxylase 1 n=1 Tax=Rhizoctonia solani TaxID=456999 RepID=A0A0K6FYB8_9AGAM|nr:Acetyl-CoA carboxylase 1 [Rhizoctonia solani]